MRYEMIGSQEIRLPDGRSVAPGAGVFDAELSEATEQFLIGIGAVRRRPGKKVSNGDLG